MTSDNLPMQRDQRQDLFIGNHVPTALEPKTAILRVFV